MQNLDEIKNLVLSKENHQNGHQKTQQYIDRPLLYNRRKFDIRCFLLITSQNGIQKGYMFQEGYIRTSSSQYTTNNLQNRTIHLTNDAIQKKSDQYGKFEGGNKVSYKEFQKYLQVKYPQQNFGKILQDIKNITYISICSVFELIDQKKKDNSFEIFGLDYMIDQDFKTYLIEVNTNPCFNTDSSLLSRLIPNMIDNALKIAIDSIYLPPQDMQKFQGNRKDIINDDIYSQNRFELIFDELIDGQKLQEIKKNQSFKHNTQIYENDEMIDKN